MRGYAYQNGDGLPQDFTKAVELFERAFSIDKQNSSVPTMLGYAYNDGKGVKKNRAKALEYFRTGSNLGNAGAMTMLAYAYLNGDGVAKNRGQAAKIAEEAISKGSLSAYKALLYINPNKFIMQVQIFLRKNGIYNRKINGLLDKYTIESLMKFCKDKNIMMQCNSAPLSPDVVALYTSFFK